MNPFSNLWIVGGIVLGVITHAIATYIPALAGVMKLSPFPNEWWPLVISSFFIPLVAIEIEKIVFKSK
jgi:hypothetical protein